MESPEKIGRYQILLSTMNEHANRMKNVGNLLLALLFSDNCIIKIELIEHFMKAFSVLSPVQRADIASQV